MGAGVNWNHTTITLGSLKPWERNPRNIGKRQAERMLDEWQRLGQFQTIAIGPEDNGQFPVYDGHQRLSTLMAAYGPDYQIQALQSDRPLTEKEREELSIVAHVGATGQFNWDALSTWDPGDLREWGLDAEALSEWELQASSLSLMLMPGGEDAIPPEDFPEYDDDIDTEYCCPKCGYEWSGKPK